jgi:hypothetical protein
MKTLHLSGLFKDRCHFVIGDFGCFKARIADEKRHGMGMARVITRNKGGVLFDPMNQSQLAQKVECAIDCGRLGGLPTFPGFADQIIGFHRRFRRGKDFQYPPTRRGKGHA